MNEERPLSVDLQADRRWYLPSWSERLRLMGWRLIYFVPLVLVVPLIVLLPILIFAWWKLLVLAIALPLSAAVHAARRAIGQRKEPFCIHCGYDLTGLTDGGRCPECGARFSHAQIEEYRRDPHWFIKRQYWNRQAPRGTPFVAGSVRSEKRRDGT